MAAERPESPDYHEDVQRYSAMYSIEQWLQPRSMVQVQLAKLKEETRCPMCFGKIRQARISMVCLHRYCAKCIEQYLRAKVPGRHGDDKECPVCRAHLHSRRATKPDHAFDKIIKALYGDVDQYDAEEEALIAQDNKAHVTAWQAQLAEMKARQAAAVAAARGLPQPANGQQQQQAKSEASPEQASWRAGNSHKATPTSASSRPPVPKGQPGWASGDAVAAAAAGLGSRKRSWNDMQQQRQASPNPAAHQGAAAGSKGGRPGLSSSFGEQLNRGNMQQQQQQRQGSGTISDDVSLLLGLSGSLPQPLIGGLAQGQPAARKKKKISTKDTAARLLSIAATSAADAAPTARCCLVHLQPYGRPVPTAAAAAGKGGRGRKEQHQQAQLLQQQRQMQQDEQQYSAPVADQPFLTCPWGLPVSSLKQLLLQQLCQQGAAADADVSRVQLLFVTQPTASVVDSESSAKTPSAAGVLSDQLTIGQLYDRWWGLGPELQIQYRLLKK